MPRVTCKHVYIVSSLLGWIPRPSLLRFRNRLSSVAGDATIALWKRETSTTDDLAKGFVLFDTPRRTPNLSDVPLKTYLQKTPKLTEVNTLHIRIDETLIPRPPLYTVLEPHSRCGNQNFPAFRLLIKKSIVKHLEVFQCVCTTSSKSFASLVSICFSWSINVIHTT